jgi:hypothetical protein
MKKLNFSEAISKTEMRLFLFNGTKKPTNFRRITTVDFFFFKKTDYFHYLLKLLCFKAKSSGLS